MTLSGCENASAKFVPGGCRPEEPGLPRRNWYENRLKFFMDNFMMSSINPAPTVHEAAGEVGVLSEGRRADVCHRGRTRLPWLLQVWPVPPLLHPG